MGDGDAALRAIEELQPAVSLLDIRMPKFSGLEVAERVQGATQVVFVTAYDQHAVAAFDQGAADYLLKPVKRRATRGHDRAAQGAHRHNAGGTRRGAAMAATHPSDARQTLRFVPVRDVTYFCSDGKYTRVVAGGSEALIRRS